MRSPYLRFPSCFYGRSVVGLTVWSRLVSVTVGLALGVVGVRADTWTNVATTGGGYFTGMNFAPDVPGLQFLRSDVAGPWLRRAPSSPWTPTRWALDSVTPRPEGDGASGLAIQPGSRGRVMFAEFGNGYGEMGLYKSVDHGTTWNRVLAQTVTANGAGKFCQPVAIDPNNPAVVYWGTLKAGVFRSLDSGATWDADPATADKIDPVSAILDTPPAATNPPASWRPTGSRTIVIDPSEVLHGRSKKVYVSVYGAGVYLSTQGGDKDTFTLIPGQPSGFGNIYDMELDGDGALYVCTTRGVAKYDGTSWQDITPVAMLPAVSAGFHRGGKRAFIALDKTFGNKKRLALFGQTDARDNSTALWRSLDGGATWEGPFNSSRSLAGNGLIRAVGATLTWPMSDPWVGAGASVVEVDPYVEGALYILDAFQVWKCDNIWAPARPTAEEPLKFHPDTFGAENLVVLALHAPKSGDALLFSGVSDVRGFRHLSLTRSPAANVNLVGTKPAPWSWSYAVSYASCEADPSDVWVATQSSTRDVARIYRSRDNGATFTGQWEPATVPHGSTMVAVSADDPDNAVILPGALPPPANAAPGTPLGEAPLRYTLDGGATWSVGKNSAGRPITGGFFQSSGAYFRDPCLAADKVDGTYFYAFKTLADADNPVGAYWSKDRGATWHRSATDFPRLPANRVTTTAPITVKTPPGRAGEIWVSLNSEGLWRSTDRGRTFSRVTALRNVNGSGLISFSFGKAASGRPESQPIVYVYGTLESGGVRGYFYSTDFFAQPAKATWTQITGFEGVSQYPTVMEADRRVPGRLYVGSTWGIGTCVVDAFAPEPEPAAAPQLKSSAVNP